MRGWGVVAVLVAIVLAIWTVAIPGLIQWRVEAALSQTLPAESIKVGVRGRPDALLAGHMSWFTVDVRRAMVDRLPVEVLSAELSHVELDNPGVLHGGPLNVRRIGAGHASLVLTEEGLRRYLEQAQGLRNARVQLAGGLLTLEGTVPLLLHEFRATMQGRFAILEGRSVVLHVDRLTVSGIALSPEIANILVMPLNPLLRVDQLPIPLRLLQVAIEDGRLTLTAEPSS